MAEINNFPEEMLTEHEHWHMRPGNPSGGGRAINPWPPTGRSPALGSGEEFLNWHNGFIDRFRNWVADLPEAQRPTGTEPWMEIPGMLKMRMVGWNSNLAAEDRQLQDMTNFETLDELGRFLEWSLHGHLHSSASQVWGDTILMSFRSPKSTYFWQLHGLIDQWRQSFVDRNAPVDSRFSVLNINGEETQARVGEPFEIDRYQFHVPNTTNLTIETTGPSDTVLYLSQVDNPNVLLDVNDDGGQGFNSRISRSFRFGTYYCYLVFYDRGDIGTYGISVRS